jgi:hypothetical protein
VPRSELRPTLARVVRLLMQPDLNEVEFERPPVAALPAAADGEIADGAEEAAEGEEPAAAARLEEAGAGDELRQ